MKVSIDSTAGFCFGVKRAIDLAEKEISESGPFACLGEIVHNPAEIQRLTNIGLISINHASFKELHNNKILFRAHGEPPETYQKAKELNICVIDATCPIVLQLQEKIKKAVIRAEKSNGQVVIFGKKGHPEITGLLGHSNGKALLTSGSDDLSMLDFSKPVEIFSQTTANPFDFEKLSSAIRENMKPFFPVANIPLKVHNTLCRQVRGRVTALRKFAATQEMLIFIGGRKSSNGRYLFEECLKINPQSFMVEGENEINHNWLKGVKKLGLTGATSTPRWLLEKIAANLRKL